MRRFKIAPQIRRLIEQRKYREALAAVVKTGTELEAVVQRLIDRGEAREALDLIAEAGDETGLSLRVRQLEGLALRRLGSWRKAQRVLGRLYDEGHRDPETLGIYAASWMDRYDKSCRMAHLRRSRELYREAFEKTPKDYYTGLNVAAKSVLLGDMKTAEEYAQQVGKLLTQSELENYWGCASAAEVELIRGNYQEAAELYRDAVLLCPDDVGQHETTWLQARRLMVAMRTPPEQWRPVEQAFNHLRDKAPAPSVTCPPYRRLRVFAFDPSVSRSMETAMINEVTLEIRWEASLTSGPVGEYLEVIDHDPASGCFYEPVDLNDRALLATDGIPPSEGDPKFHQQMVYGIGMNVIDAFERALGRQALWSARQIRDEDNNVVDERFVRRLRVYPHAMREANAYYSPAKKALLFGYFPAEVEDDPKVLPGGTVFSALSHDVIAHEMSHALLDGLHPHFAEPSNVDVLAFHEAFADIVALFQHFSHRDVLHHEIARTRGELESGNLLGQLAQELGRAIGKRGALRRAIGRTPDPAAMDTTVAPHDRGGILVAAVFDAFLAIYRARSADLKRIASQGSGVLAPGAVHPDLAARLAQEAAKTASHILQICIRALDYCPPVDITFGDYLRAIITADVDLVPDDRYNYRVAIIESFQRHGIYPADVRNLSVESLVWRPPRGKRIDMQSLFDEMQGRPSATERQPTSDREKAWLDARHQAALVHRWLIEHCSSSEAHELGLSLAADGPRSVCRKRNRPEVEVHSVRLARRNTPRGDQVADFVIEILQRRFGYLDPDKQDRVDRARRGPPRDERPDFVFRGGCTLLVDPATREVRYAITKHILSPGRLRQQREFLGGSRRATALRATYFGDPLDERAVREPFAALHRPLEVGEP